MVDSWRPQRILRTRIQHPGQCPDPDRADDRGDRRTGGRRAGYRSARAGRRADPGKPLLHIPRAPTCPTGEQNRRHGASLRAQRAAHVHRDLRRDAAGVLEHRRPAPGLAGRVGVGLPDRCDRHDRSVRRPLHPQADAPGRDARHAGRHLDHVHLDAARRADVGGGLDRSAGARHHPDRLLHRREVARQHPSGTGRAVGGNGDRMGRRLHVSTRRRAGCSTASPTSRRSSEPRSRWASTTSPKR